MRPVRLAILLLVAAVVPLSYFVFVHHDDISTDLIPIPYIFSGGDAFITTWKTTTHNDTIVIPARGSYTVDWGDGSVDANVTGRAEHKYAFPGQYLVSISGNLTGIRLYDSPDAAKLQSIG